MSYTFMSINYTQIYLVISLTFVNKINVFVVLY